jgi:hypothetical protein
VELHAMPIQISIDERAIAEFCQRWGIVELDLFGSVCETISDPKAMWTSS